LLDAMSFHVSKTDFADLVQATLEELPPEFAGFVEEVSIEIRDRPSPEQMQHSSIPRDGLLLGLYHGRPRTRRSVEESGVLPDVIYLFQHHIETASHSRQDLARQIRITVLHEIGHHFGMSEEDLEKLGYR
jgi:predicted Zn-dependent protease with MMP-like domain